MKLPKFLTGLSVAAVAFGVLIASIGPVEAKTITIRIASGHPPAVVYAGLMKNYFQTELKKRVEERTEHKINFVVNDQYILCRYLEKMGKLLDWWSAVIHKCLRLDQNNIYAFNCAAPELTVMLLPVYRDIVGATQAIQYHKSDIVTGFRIVIAWIAQTHNQSYIFN